MPDTQSSIADRVSTLLSELNNLAASPAEPVLKNSSTSARPGRSSQFSAMAREEEIQGPTDASTLESISPAGGDAFFPVAPRSMKETGLSDGEIESLIIKQLAVQNSCPGREIAKQVGLPFPLIEPYLHSLKAQRMVVYKTTTTASDYIYDLTEQGMKAAQELRKLCSYSGVAPVPLSQYVHSVNAQSLQKIQPQWDDLKRSIADLTLGQTMFDRLMRAVISGRGLFLYGRPGNGKTSIAERVCAAYGSSLWIPRALSVFGEIIRLYDPSCHEPLPQFSADKLLQEEATDQRWIRIRRPTIVVGGELTMEKLELKYDEDTGICEAPIQMKSNCGVLVIDDFGRQRISPAELLNRWIVPLEKRIDYLSLPSGRKICVPFDQFPIFATNLEPKDLVDEAFLRRIPYKIDVENPTEQQFRDIWQQSCKRMGIAHDEAALEHLLANHYRDSGRELRFCHARDLLLQVSIYCKASRKPLLVNLEGINAVAKDYFSIV